GPLTRSTHGPSTGASPSIVMPSAVKKAIAAARSSTTTLTWSNLLIVMSLVEQRPCPAFRAAETNRTEPHVDGSVCDVHSSDGGCTRTRTLDPLIKSKSGVRAKRRHIAPNPAIFLAFG